MLAGTLASRTLWAISRYEGGGLEVLTAGSGEVLPVFGFEEEAALYLRFEAPEGEGWRLRRVTSGEMISLVSGCCRNTGFVALDPLPRDFGLSVHPVVMGREEFLAKLALGGGGGALAGAPARLARPAARSWPTGMPVVGSASGF